MSIKKAVKWMCIWIGLAFLFNIGVFILMGRDPALEFLGGYVIEQSLSIDNLFLFLLVFSTFGITPKHQRKVLTYGIAGAVVLRLAFILLGLSIISLFHWVLYIFGVILIIGGIKMMTDDDKEKDFKKSFFFKLLNKIIPITDKLHGDKFLIRQNRKLYATPLLAVLVLIEGTDILFAVDSIPAIFSITTNAFIIYTSNIFSILGLRNMYFLLERLHKNFRFVKYGVGMILLFTGLKLSLLFLNVQIPIVWSLVIIFFILFLSIITSVIFKVKIADDSI
ncbi:MAG TPA: TerC/Alx family metal homeostasis membrane protein [Clostridia bacterium]|nr:TerC/Alx family metal homeostasis membrane protein [Clostridia bacterium]